MKQIIDLFLEHMRTDVYSVSTPRGYHPVTEEITPKKILETVSKGVSIGMYFIFPEGKGNRVKAIAMDVDQDDESIVRKLCQSAVEKIPDSSILVEKTGGRGWHIWIFIAEEIQAAAARMVCRVIVGESGIQIPVEIYPKQDRIQDNKKFGNLMRVPIGPHPRTGNLGRLFTPFLEEIDAKDLSITPVPSDVILEVAKLNYVRKGKPSKPEEDKPDKNENNLPCIANFLGGVNEGFRDEAIFRLAAYLKRQGLPKEATMVTVRMANNNNKPPLENEEVIIKVDSAYNGGFGLPCSSSLVGLDSSFCSKDCPVYFKAKSLQQGMGATNPSYRKGQPIIIESADGYYLMYKTSSGHKEVRLSNFIIKPMYILEMNQSTVDEMQEEVFRAEVITSSGSFIGDIPSSAFNSKNSFLKHFNKATISWFGTDTHLQVLKSWLSEKDSLERKQASTKLGRVGETDYWIMPDTVIDENGIIKTPDWVYYKPSHFGNVRIATYGSSQDKKRSLEAIRNIHMVNSPRVVYPVIGWTFAVPHKNYFMRELGHFPLLMLFGTRGSGKTQMVQRMILPLFGYSVNEPQVIVCDTTRFVWVSYGASTTTIPIFMDEYRPNAIGFSRVKSLWDFWRHIYTADIDYRGQADLTRLAFSQSSPIVVAGEEIIPDPALMERFIQVQLSIGSLTPERRENFVKFPDMSLVSLEFIKYSLSVGMESIVDEARDILGYDFYKSVSPRIFDNTLVSMAGLLSWSKMVDVEITDEMIDSVKQIEGMTKGKNKRTSLWVDEFIQDLSIILETDGGIWGELVDEEGARHMSFNLPMAYSEWTRYAKVRGKTVVSSDTLKRQLGEEENTPYIYARNTQARIYGVNRRVYKVDLAILDEMLEGG